MLYCPNSACQTPNDETQKYCQKCGIFLPKQYLWAVGSDAAIYKPGELLMGRYLCKRPRLFLDTQPAQMPEPFQDIPAEFAPYLRLSPFRLHVPQVYDVIGDAADPSRQILLLDKAAIADPTVHGHKAEGAHLLPGLSDAWPTAQAFRQLNWLWQIVQLWQPLQSQSVATSLLTPDLIRVEGPIIRLLELKVDGTTPDLTRLGALWKTWQAQAKPEISAFLGHLCDRLIQKQIWSPEQLLDCLDQALTVLGQSQARHLELATQTDQGPSRQRNEDACFPPSGTHQAYAADQTTARTPLVIVCDGIGGHQGGDVASGLAIASVQHHIEPLPLQTLSSVDATVDALENAVRQANDVISQRNDNEQRLERQRMGTTLVMGLVHNHQLYVTHVGDSRAYWITRYGCHQITLDDDIASREVRLGYGSYRQALQQPIAGSLVQALGMGPSTALHPTVQRFMLDEDSIFLLCSDGLSDFDRIEETWDATLLPAVYGKTSIAEVVPQLVKIANMRNGHDNVTVGLLYCRVAPAAAITVPVECAIPATAQAPPTPITELQPTQIAAKSATPITALSDPTPPRTASPASAKTAVVPQKPSRPSLLPLLLGIAGLLALSVGLIYFLFPGYLQRTSERSPSPGASPEPTATAAETLPPAQLNALETGLMIEALNPVTLLATGEVDAEKAGVVPVGSVLEVRQKRVLPNQPAWVELVVCSIPQQPEELSTPSSPNTTLSPRPEQANRIPNTPFPDLSRPSTPAPSPPVGTPRPTTLPELTFLTPNDQGWARESDVLNNVRGLSSPTFMEQGICAASPTPTSTPASPGSSSTSSN